MADKQGGGLSLAAVAVNEIGRLLNGRGHPDEVAIAHLALAACRTAEFLGYLADLDDQRFRGAWPVDGYANDAVDDGFVRSAAAAGLSSLDLCVASAGRLSGFAKNPPRGEDSVRTFYSQKRDRRHLVPAPWRSWVDAVTCDPQYASLLDVRNALMHADTIRTIHGTTGAVAGHSMRFGYHLGPLKAPVAASTHNLMSARGIVELARDTAHRHVSTFLDTLKAIP